MKAYIHSFESFGTKDGPGIRFVLFLQGCPLRCLYCHNPDTWSMADHKLTYTAQELFKEVDKVKGFIKSGGITVSGGEPLLQAEFIKELFLLCREAGIHTAIDTSGYLFNEAIQEVLELTDLVLLDVKHIDEQKYKKLTSRPLEPTLSFLDYLQSIHKPTWVRYVLIPGYTDDKEDIQAWAKKMAEYPTIERVDILPFHQMGSHKWEQMGKEYSLTGVEPPTDQEVAAAEQIVLSYNLPLASSRDEG